MNRIIKYRVWNVGKQKMFQNDELIKELICIHYQDKVNYIPLLNYITVVPQQEDFIALEYTGLLDKKGKEIYEGDIIIFTNGKTGYYKIFYENGAFLFKVEDDSILPLYFADRSYIKVVGNVYENSELLK